MSPKKFEERFYLNAKKTIENRLFTLEEVIFLMSEAVEEPQKNEYDIVDYFFLKKDSENKEAKQEIWYSELEVISILQFYTRSYTPYDCYLKVLSWFKKIKKR